MYEKIPFFLGTFMGSLGLIMAIAPKNSTKKEDRESEQAIKKTRMFGIVLTIIGIGLFIIGFINK